MRCPERRTPDLLRQKPALVEAVQRSRQPLRSRAWDSRRFRGSVIVAHVHLPLKVACRCVKLCELRVARTPWNKAHLSRAYLHVNKRCTLIKLSIFAEPLAADAGEQ